MCGCSIDRKTASLSSNCGINCCNKHKLDAGCDCKKPNLKQYNTTHNIDMELKWTEFKLNDNEQQQETASD